MIERYTQYLANAGIVENEDMAFYSYGFRMAISIIINFISAFAIGYAFSMIPETLLFMLVYLPLRSFAGGYHAGSQRNCYILGIALIIVVLLGIRFIPWTNLICVFLVLISSVIVIFLAPVEDRNKPLDETEIKTYSIKAKAILFVNMSIFVLAMAFNTKNYAVCISVSLFAAGMMLIIGKIKNKLTCRK